jgi:hypothetical protein
VSAAVPRAGAPAPARGASSPPGATLARLPPAWTIAAALAVVYLILAPASPDLAAASYRSSLFSSAGFTLWDNSWYGGHHLLAYSVLAPALGTLIGPRLLAAISMVIATALFASVIDGWLPTRATRIAAAWFALGASVALLSSRVPFDLGLAIGLGAVLATRRRRLAIALALSVLTALASPVAGAFLALAFLAWALAGPARAWPAALTFAALAPIALLTLAFPEGGSQPFVGSAFYPEVAGVLVILALIEREHRMLRIGVALYALALAGSFVLSTAVGGNADRLGALAAGPVAALALVCASRWRRRALLVLAPFLLYWQANAPVADYVSTLSNPSVEASYYTPLIGELHALGVGYGARPARIEVVATADHWEARFLAPHVMIARGWERQLDSDHNGVFYEDRTLTPARYRAWLLNNAISYVALPDAPLDYSATAEARLLRGVHASAGDAIGGTENSGTGGGDRNGNGASSYLREVWRSAHWRLFVVLGAQPLAQPPAMMTSLGSDSFTIAVPRAGSMTVRVRFTPYWAISGGRGCVREAPGGWTEVQVRHAGSMHVGIDFSLERVFDHGPRCRLG